MAKLLLTLILGFSFSVFANEELPSSVEEDSVPAMLKETENPNRLTEIRDALDAIAKPEKIELQEFEGILKTGNGFRFYENQAGDLPKPTFEWIQNNLFAGIEKPLVGVFTLKDAELTLGYLVVKREQESAPVIYLVSPQGELKHLTRRL